MRCTACGFLACMCVTVLGESLHAEHYRLPDVALPAQSAAPDHAPEREPRMPLMIRLDTPAASASSTNGFTTTVGWRRFARRYLTPVQLGIVPPPPDAKP